MKLFAVSVILLCLFSSSIYGDSRLSPFVLPWDDAISSPTNVSALLHKPAGRYGHIKSLNGHLYAGKNRFRMFGVNMTITACFPEHKDAQKIAARMAKFGINCVRFHHMDASWSNDVLMAENRKDLNPEQLDRLDYFVYQLKMNGIYTDLNLHVSRDYPDMPGWEGRPDFYKGVDIFYPPMIDMQKDYARKLLTHYNPYIKSKYIDDPAIVIVEINNENGLINQWAGWTLDNMSSEYQESLFALWNKWLRNRYGNNQNLRKSWKPESIPLGHEMLENADFKKGESGWVLEKHENADADLDFSSDSESAHFARIRITKVDDTGWHIQFHQPGLRIEKNKWYTLGVKIRADRKKRVSFGLQQNGEPWESFWYTSREINTNWQTLKFSIKCKGTCNDTKLSLTDLGNGIGEVDIAAVSMREGYEHILPSGDLGKAEIIKRSEFESYSSSVKADWLQFLWDTENSYWTGMRDYLKNELKCKSLIVGTAAGFSPSGIQSKLDMVDCHAYWQHPVFPGRPWDSEDWYVNNIPMAGYQDGGTIGYLAPQRVFGKPFIVTEYNHPSPNVYSSETFLILSAYAALQDWDGIFAFDYQADRSNWNSRKSNGFFEIDQNPVKMATIPSASTLFLRSDVKPARNVKSFHVPPQKYMEYATESGGWVSSDRFGVSGLDCMSVRVGQSMKAAAGKPQPLAGSVVKSDTGQLLWDTGNHLALLNSPLSAFYTGPGDDKLIQLGKYSIKVNKTDRNWITAAMTSMDGKPLSKSSRILFVLCGYMQNTGMVWKDEKQNSVGNKWGESPSLVECISADISMPARKGLQVWALDEKGQHSRKIEPETVKAIAGFNTGPQYGTLWYEISAVDNHN